MNNFTVHNSYFTFYTSYETNSVNVVYSIFISKVMLTLTINYNIINSIIIIAINFFNNTSYISRGNFRNVFFFNASDILYRINFTIISIEININPIRMIYFGIVSIEIINITPIRLNTIMELYPIITGPTVTILGAYFSITTSYRVTPRIPTILHHSALYSI